MEYETKEYLILKSIHEGKETIRQRDIAKIVNISLGMTNSIIKKLIEKGLLKVKHINQKKINYLLTTKGISIITKRSSDFLKRTIKNVVIFKDAIDLIVNDIRIDGFKTINFIGESDLLFLIESACVKNKINLRLSDDVVYDDEVKNIFSENFLPGGRSSSIYLVKELEEVMKVL